MSYQIFRSKTTSRRMCTRQLCRILTTVVPKSFKRKVTIKRMYCSSYGNNDDKFVKQVESGPPVWKKEAEEFMLNLDEDASLKKTEIEILIEILRHENEPVPDVISPWDWKILITECDGYAARVNYLNYLHKRNLKFFQMKEEKELQRLENMNAVADRAFAYRQEREKRRKWWQGLESFKSDIPVVVDLEYEQDLRLQRFVFEQINHVWQNNLNHLQPLDLHFTSVRKNYRMESLFEGNNNMYPLLNLHEEHFLELFDREKLVYLTSDGPPLLEFEPSCIYVLGGTEDLEPLQSFSMARKYGLRYASFPIPLYYRLASHMRYSLNLSIAYKVLLDMYLCHSWLQAFSSNLQPDQFLLSPGYNRLDKVNQRFVRHRRKRQSNVPKLLNILNKK